jgi:heat shock protein HtpX
MKYVGLQSQIWRNNTYSIILMVLFPLILYGLVWLFFFLTSEYQGAETIDDASIDFITFLPWVTGAAAIWFMIAYNSHTSMIMRATASKPLERRENKRVYNLTENLAIAAGMTMPKINIIEDDSLNAFASGINRKTYTVTLSRGIINKLNDDELEGVIAHELTHIRNKDVRLLIVSIVFVGIFSFLANVFLRAGLYSGGRGSGGKNRGGAYMVGFVLAMLGIFMTTLCRFALSRKREYLADAGGAELTKKPWALASALRKVSGDPRIEAVTRSDVAQMFIENPQDKKKRGFSFNSLFATHPPIKDRITLLEQF